MNWVQAKIALARDFFRFVGRRAARWMFLGVCGTLILSGVELGIAYSIPLFLKAVGLVDPKLLSASFHYSSSMPAWLVGVGLIFLGILRFLGQYLVNQSGTASQEEISARLRRLLIFRTLLQRNQVFLPAAQSNYFLGTTFPQTSTAVFYMAIATAQALQCAGLILVMTFVSWKEALVGISGLGLIGVLVRQINRAIDAHVAPIPLQQKSLVRGIQRVAHNWLLVRVIRIQRIEHASFSRNISAVFSKTVKAASLSNIASSVTPLLGIVLLTLIVSISHSYWATSGGVLLSFLYIFIRFVQGLSVTVGSITQVKCFLPQFKEAKKFFGTFTHADVTEALEESAIAPTIVPVISPSRNAAPELGPSISFQNVSFAYDKANVLEDFSLDIPPGQTIGIVGPSGSGKSTFLLLLLGILKPTTGTIFLGETSAADVLLTHELNVGYVGPEPFLFEGSIRDNLAYGLHHTADKDLWEALAMARLDEVVRNIDGQLEHLISEKGDGLSAGQKQRLCLARVFIRRPALIILDEATANLDTKTEEEVIGSLATLKSKATIVIVTHRATTIKHADYVFDMERRELRAIRSDREAVSSGRGEDKSRMKV